MSNQKDKIEDLKDLENWMKSLADQVRAMADAPKYILPLIFYKRLNDVYEDEFEKVSQTITDREVAKRVARMGGVVRFTIPDEARFEEIRKTTQNLGEKLTQALRSIVKENPKLQGVIDIADYNETSAGQRIISDHQISRLIEIIAQKRLGLNDVEPDLLGRAYEYLLRIYAEGSGKSAGEFYTPRTVTYLMAYLLDPEEGQEVYDPACGSGGLLIKCALVLKEKLGEELKRPLRLYGQERNHLTYAISKMNLFLHDLEGEILMGDTFSNPRFLEKRELRRFDLVVANPMWNQDDYDERFYQRDKYNRFTFGFSPSNSADWGWIQHMLASLNQKGKMGVVLDTGAVSRGGREKAIRQKFVEKDLIESIVLLPENLFYNTGAPGIIMIINKSKPKERKGKIMLINASQEYEKGKPKNYLEEKNIKKIKDAYHNWQEIEGLTKIITFEEAAKNDFNLSPSRYVSIGEVEEYRPIEEITKELTQIDKTRQKVEERIKEILGKLKKS